MAIFNNIVLDQPQWLWILLWLFLLIPFWGYSWRKIIGFKKSWNRHPFIFKGKLPSWRFLFAKTVFCFSALFLVALALADPYYIRSQSSNFYQGVRIFFLVDTSRSMVMAEDILPNRLLAVKNEIKEITANLDGQYQLAIIPFAGVANAYYHLPSFDQASFFLALKQLDTETIPVSGTDTVGAFLALDMALDAVSHDSQNINLILFFSDGGKEEDFLVDRVQLGVILTKLAGKSCRFYINGVGDDTQDTYLIKRSASGDFVGYLTDANNKPRVSRLDEDLLQMMAKLVGGQYSRLALDNSTLRADLKEVVLKNRRLEKVGENQDRVPLRSYVLYLAVFLLLISRINVWLVKNKNAP